MDAAHAYAKLSYAKRLKVGAVLVKDDRIISVGYNGTPSGRDNDCEYVEIANAGKFGQVSTKTLVTKPELVHAEMNVIAFAAKNGMSTKDCTMVITHSPCFECSKLIVQAGITNVLYETEYRILDGIKFLQECNVKVRKLNGTTKATS